MDTTTTAPAAPPNSTPGDAAARTFAVTELLESILLHVESFAWGKHSSGDRQRVSDDHFKGPALSLFQLQRVSRAFRDTIQGSTQLQRLMLTVPVDKDCYAMTCWRKSDVGKYAPCVWFFEFLGMRETWCDLYDDEIEVEDIHTCKDDADYPENFTAVHKAHDDFLARGGACPTASWRRIKLGPAQYTKSIGFYVRVFVGGPLAGDDADEVVVHFDLAADDTLGDLFGKWSALIKVVKRQMRRYELLQDVLQDLSRKEHQELFELDTEELNALSMPYRKY